MKNKKLCGLLAVSALSLATVGAGLLVNPEVKASADSDVRFEMTGAGVRLEDPTGLRFEALVGKDLAVKENVTFGVIIFPENIMEMFKVSKDIFENTNRENLPKLATLEENVDEQKRVLIASHFARLAEGNCHVDVSPYFSSVIVGFERIGDHLVNVGYSINNPTGSQKENV